MTLKIALLGATSHIAKGLISGLLAGNDDLRLELFAREPHRVESFFATEGMAFDRCGIAGFSGFATGTYDAVINCVGIGSPAKLKGNPAAIFAVTEEYDTLVLDYLQRHSDARYVNLSSGAAYGPDFSRPVDESSPTSFQLNSLSPEEYYGVAKFYSEARHRSLPAFNIVDLRVFGYFSHFADLSEPFLVSDIVRAMLADREFVTGAGNIVRDYVHPDDLCALILSVIDRGRVNDVYDVYSASPVSKLEILEEFRCRFGLRFRIDESFQPVTITGMKHHYYSNSRKAGLLGYRPRHTSLATVVSETSVILGRRKVGCLTC